MRPPTQSAASPIHRRKRGPLVVPALIRKGATKKRRNDVLR
jgi:hypothetical protein